jgi:toxin ParE1/3/4
MGFFLGPVAERELDEIWLYIARASGSLEAADRVIDSISECCALLGINPRIGRQRVDLRPDLRSFVVGEYVVIYRIQEDDALILHVMHGSRDIENLLD